MTNWSNTPFPHEYRRRWLPMSIRKEFQALGEPDDPCIDCCLPQDAHNDPAPPEVELRELGPAVAPRLFGEGI